MKKTILVCGGAGFIGHHLARRLKNDGHFVVVADIKYKNPYCYSTYYCDDYFSIDLTDNSSWEELERYYDKFDEIYQLAADMGGAGYIFTGENDLNVMTNSAMINLLAVKWAIKWNSKIFYSSSACMYPAYNQEDPSNPKCSEDSAYPAAPDSEYGWEKLFSERLYLAARRNASLEVRIARFHNIYGPEGVWEGGKEKAPAAFCRKIALAPFLSQGEHWKIDVWGPGNQTRSFLYIDDCIEAIIRLMQSDFTGPVNVGSEEMISMNDFLLMVAKVAGKNVCINNIPGPVGVMGRNSDNKLIREKLQWEPTMKLEDGIRKTYKWIESQVNSK